MWTYIEKKNGDTRVGTFAYRRNTVSKSLNHDEDRTSSFYVGDAAGRPEGWKSGAPKDWNDTDR
jgi:hypothetical protein